MQPSMPPAKRQRNKSNIKTVNPYHLRNDRLGTLASSLANDLEAAGSWSSFVHSFRGRSYLSEELDHLSHPAAILLREWRDQGVPVKTSAEPWSFDNKDSCVERGCHRSATEHTNFLHEEMSEFIDN